VIVLDASVVLEVLLHTPVGRRVASRILDERRSLHAPHVLDLEVTQVLRRYERAGDLSLSRARAALDDLAGFALRRYPHDLLLRRIWELRANLTAYDAAYVALAEHLGAVLLTRDGRLAAAPGHRASVEVA
jgi:predicted nucleic acid-binding protein